MAIGKRVKTGGSHYTGSKLTVDAVTGDYTLDITFSEGSAVNGISITPTKFGSLDNFKLEHLDANSALVVELGTTIYNIGAGASIILDLASLELFDANHKLRLTYTNVAGVALTVFVLVERIR